MAKRGPQPREDKIMIKELRSQLYWLRKEKRDNIHDIPEYKLYRIIIDNIIEYLAVRNIAVDDAIDEVICTKDITLFDFHRFVCNKYNR